VKITGVKVWVTRVPLACAVGISKKLIGARDHTIVNIETDEGITGLGYTWGYQSSLVTGECIARILAPLIINQDPLDTETLWDQMFNTTTAVGRKGLLVRAISAVDIALWDIKGKKTKLPLYKLLGGSQRGIPVYASGGYYRENNSLEGLADEMKRYVEKGYGAVKMKIGGTSLRNDVERVRLVRETIGEHISLMLDANGAWHDSFSALAACHAYEEFSPCWIEEPLPPDQYLASAKVAAATDIPIAGGEQEYTRWGFTQLIQSNAVDIIQPNATVAGGITEWMKISSLASSLGATLAPHANPYIHVHLAAAFSNAMIIEYFEPREKIKVIGELMENLVEPSGGVIHPPEKPGLGITLNEEARDKYTIAKWDKKGRAAL